MNVITQKYNLPQDNDPICVVSGDIEVRLARTDEEIRAGQRLRYKVFFEEMGAKPSRIVQKEARDFDEFDEICDHLLAFDNSKSGEEKVVATYRLLREELVDKKEDFYSSAEFDLGNLYNDYFRKLMGDRQLLELGRSCVREEYRTNAVMHLMWKFIARYIDRHKIAYLFGCASLSGTDQQKLKLPLSYLFHHHKTPPEYNVPALPEQKKKMDYLKSEDINRKEAMRSLAPLVRGYLRLGCYIGDGAVIDEQFGTTDVFILLPIDRLETRYLSLWDD